MSDRPTFYTIDNEPIRACGVIFYKKNKLTGDIKILIEYSNNIYEDIGGKTDILDKDIYDTIIRETIEETNGVITKQIIDKYILANHHLIYVSKAKYILMLVEANNDIINIDNRRYGTVEKLTGKIRQFQWINYNRLKHSTVPFNERVWFVHNKIYNYLS